MRGMPLTGGAQEGKAGILQEQLLLGLATCKGHELVAGGFWEPTSVLDHRPSPNASPPTSVSTLSSPLGAAADVAALAGTSSKNVSRPPPAWPGGGAGEEAAGGKEEWDHQLLPLDMGLGPGEGWDATGEVLPEAAQTPGLSHENTFLRWIIGGEEASAAMGGVMDPPVLELDHIPSMLPQPPLVGPNLPIPAAAEDTKAAPFGPPPSILLQHHHHVHQQPPHAALFSALPSFDTAPSPPPKRHHPMAGAQPPKLPPFASYAAAAGGFVNPTLKPKAEAASDDAAAAVDQLAEAAKLVEAGDAFGAREILARLNYRLPAAPTTGTPLLRSAFYFKEVLRLALSPTGDAPVSAASTPFDVVLKLGAYKAFSDVSPVLQFAHFTCVQAVLDELGGADCIHVLDFDIGLGEQWASLMQELAQRCPGAALKVTALVSTTSHHPLELQLIHENLSHFAAELDIPFQFAVFNLDTMDLTELLAIAGGEVIAVHLPVGSAHASTMPAILYLVKRLGAKVVVSVDHGCDRGELPFAAHLFEAFKSCVCLLESLDAVGTKADVVSKIERLLIHPRIEHCVLGWRHAAATGNKMLPWRTMFASAGFVPVQISSFAKAQAELLLKKVLVRGFHVENHAGSLFLYWQRGELMSVSAWRC